MQRSYVHTYVAVTSGLVDVMLGVVCLGCASGDGEDEEGTIEEQEGVEGGLDHRAELEELQQEGVSE